MNIVNAFRSKIEQVVLAAILFACGILLCLKMDAETLSVIVGALLIAYGALIFLFLILKKRSIASKVGYFACIAVSFGITFIADKVVSFFVYMLPYITIVVGAVLFADAFLGRYYRKDGNVVLFVVKLSVGAALMAFSICLLTIKSMAPVTPVIFGAILILAAAALIANIFVKKKAEKDEDWFD